MRTRHYTLLEVVIVLIVLVIMGGIFMPTLSHSPESRRRTNCAYNLKEIGLQTLMYSGENDGFFPNAYGPETGSGKYGYGNWAPVWQTLAPPPATVTGLSPRATWSCPSASEPKTTPIYSNYRYVGSGRRDDNDHATLVSLGYDAWGNHPKKNGWTSLFIDTQNDWMNALFIDGHAEGAWPDGSKTVTYNIPGGTQTSSWNRNDW